MKDTRHNKDQMILIYPPGPRIADFGGGAARRRITVSALMQAPLQYPTVHGAAFQLRIQKGYSRPTSTATEPRLSLRNMLASRYSRERRRTGMKVLICRWNADRWSDWKLADWKLGQPDVPVATARAIRAVDALSWTSAAMVRCMLLLGLLLGLGVAWTIDVSAAAERRMALVVGAAEYAHAPALAHTLDDARDIAAALKRLGFEVDLVLNPNRAELENAVVRLGEKSRGADTALFYYSGHALQSQGVNWILPVSADIQNDRVLRFQALDLDAVLEQVKGLARVSLIFLDACRDDPFKQRLGSSRDVTRSGLAAVNATTSGTYLAYATAIGMVAADGNGPHSPFTGSLLKYIETPGLELRQLMSKVHADVEEATDRRQIPWDYSSLTGDFYFNPANSAKVDENVAQAINGPNPQIDLDALFWESVDKKKAGDLNAYLVKFPQGTFAELARSRLAELKAPPIAPSVQPNPKLLDAISDWLTSATPKYREDFAAAYQEARRHRALAYNPSGRTLNWVSGRPSELEAEESALERCETYTGTACGLLALDDDIRSTTGSSSPLRAMPRVHYAGPFDPERIPQIDQSVRKRPDIAGYVAAPAYKAASYHYTGRVFVVTGATDQHAAEVQALAACNDDPSRNGQGGPCYLYASGDGVVFPRRSSTPITAAAAVPPKIEKPLVAVTTSSTAAFHDAFAGQIERALPSLGTAQRDGLIKSFEAAAAHKAFAVHGKDGGVYRLVGWPVADAVEEATLEGCQSYYGEPCTLLAVDDVMRVGADEPFTPRDMARVHYAGVFDTSQIPAVSLAVRNRGDLLAYSRVGGPRAVAFHPWGQVYVAFSTTSQNEAEVKALAACNDEPTRKNTQGGPCYLYASASQVVFDKRLRLPVAPAAGNPLVVSAPSPKPVTADDTGFLNALVERVKGVLPKESQPSFYDYATRYYVTFQQASNLHRAFAVGSKSGGNVQLGLAYGEPTAASAQQLALERCQLHVVDPCSLIAFDRNITPANQSAVDMARLRYDGTFDVSQLPGLAIANRTRSDVASYDHAPFPKAAVIDVHGNIVVVTGTSTQADAEAQAFRKCAPPCYLYAVGNQVVLPQRWSQPRLPGNTLVELLSYAMAYNPAKLASDFNGWKQHKALVLFPELRQLWPFSEFPSADAAERVALEACGLKYNTSCVTLAVDDKLNAKDPSALPRRAMPRLTYQGPYRPEMVPLFATTPRIAVDYTKMRQPKAMAIRPTGLKIVAESGTTLAEAEAKALAGCTDPDSPFPCFLYAVNENVILPQRRTEPEQ